MIAFSKAECIVLIGVESHSDMILELVLETSIINTPWACVSMKDEIWLNDIHWTTLYSDWIAPLPPNRAHSRVIPGPCWSQNGSKHLSQGTRCFTRNNDQVYTSLQSVVQGQPDLDKNTLRRQHGVMKNKDWMLPLWGCYNMIWLRSLVFLFLFLSIWNIWGLQHSVPRNYNNQKQEKNRFKNKQCKIQAWFKLLKSNLF